MTERFCISSQVTLAHLEILLQEGKKKTTVKKENFSNSTLRWKNDEFMEYNRRSNEEVSQ